MLNPLSGVDMNGIHYVTNEKGERIAVQIDLRKHGDLWEELYDSLTARKRAKEPRETVDAVKARLAKPGKLHG
jgi:hypothetical protein